MMFSRHCVAVELIFFFKLIGGGRGERQNVKQVLILNIIPVWHKCVWKAGLKKVIAKIRHV